MTSDEAVYDATPLPEDLIDLTDIADERPPRGAGPWLAVLGAVVSLGWIGAIP